MIKMAEVKGLFENLGFACVSTLLQTGNVLFEASESDTAKIKGKIEAGLGNRFSYDARVQVFPFGVLSKIVENSPFEDEGSEYHSYVLFMEGGLGREFVNEAIVLEQGERIQLGDAVVYWRCRKGHTLQSQVGKYLSKAKYRDYNTSRNLKTLKKLVGNT